MRAKLPGSLEEIRRLGVALFGIWSGLLSAALPGLGSMRHKSAGEGDGRERRPKGAPNGPEPEGLDS
jgi:hypothetical protein